VSHKNVTKVVRYILAQLSSLNNARFNVQRFKGWITAEISHQMLEEIGQQPEIGQLNPETSEPRTLNL
jgi:hypothetical protein